MPRSLSRADHRRHPWSITAAATAAFLGTLAIPAVTVLWWALAAGLAMAALVLIRARRVDRQRVSRAGAAARGR
jgi:hypothetical protein